MPITSHKLEINSVKDLKTDLDSAVTLNEPQTIKSLKTFDMSTDTVRTDVIMASKASDSNKWSGSLIFKKGDLNTGYCESYLNSGASTKDAVMQLTAHHNVDGTDHYASLAVGVRGSDGSVYATAPSTPDNPYDTVIVTADYVRKFLTPTGSIIVWSASNSPAGYLICDGSAISRTTYARLFQVIGTTWGAGNGKTTFNVPNLTFGNYISNPTVYGTGSVMRVGANTAANVRNVFITSARAQGNILMAIDGGEIGGNCFWAPEALGLYAKTDNVKTAKLCIRY